MELVGHVVPTQTIQEVLMDAVVSTENPLYRMKIHVRVMVDTSILLKTLMSVVMLTSVKVRVVRIVLLMLKMCSAVQMHWTRIPQKHNPAFLHVWILPMSMTI